jgi:MFS family permease
LLLHRNVMLCALISCLFVTWFVVIISFAPSFLLEVKHYSAAQMSLVMSCLGAAWVIWGFVVPALSDRIGRKPAMVIFAFIAACCPIALMHVASPLALGLLMLATYTGLGCFTLFMSTIPAETVPPAAMASTLGLIMGVGELIGGFVAPTAAGFAADRYGLFVTMWIAAGGALLAGVASMFLTETAPAALARHRHVLTQFVQRSDA